MRRNLRVRTGSRNPRSNTGNRSNLRQKIELNKNVRSRHSNLGLAGAHKSSLDIKKTGPQRTGYSERFNNYSAFGAPAFAGTTLIFFVTKPLRRQRVQTFKVRVVPAISVFTLRRFGLQVRRVWLYDLETLLPVIEPFKQTSQTLDIIYTYLKINST